MSFKIPCGGFKLDEKVFSLDENGVLSIPKPLTYDYMPEGYPKKDGWSIEWDGNIDGKTSAVGAPLYKFSDRMLSYEEFLSAKLVNPSDSSQFIMVSTMRPKQEKFSDAISVFSAGDLKIYVISEDNAEVREEGIIFPTKGLYASGDTAPFKLITETITPMDANFIPNTIQRVGDDVIISSSTPDSTKKFKITVDDSGVISATAVT